MRIGSVELDRTSYCALVFRVHVLHYDFFELLRDLLRENRRSVWVGSLPAAINGPPNENGHVQPIGVVILCPAGFETILADATRQELPKFVEERISGGFIHGRTVAPVRQLRRFPCATNVFVVVDEVPRSTVDLELTALRRRLPQIERPPRLPTSGTVRLRVHDDVRGRSAIRPGCAKAEKMSAHSPASNR